MTVSPDRNDADGAASPPRRAQPPSPGHRQAVRNDPDGAPSRPARPVWVGRPTPGPRAAATWTRRQQLLTELRAIRGRSYPRIRGLAREKSWLFFEILLPFLSTSAFVFVYRALEAPREYIGFVVLGGAMTAFWLNVIWMMAAQLYWEKDQGNLELYFAAPMDLTSVLLGMAVGGLVMSASRAVVVLFVATVVYGVTFDVASWLLLGLVFGLTLAALYGLGMVLASLFLMWGREAWHLTQLLTEPIYFVSGLNFPVGRLGLLGALAIATIPLAVGLDAMRQLAFRGAPSFGTPRPEVEAFILVVMTIVFLGLARVALRVLEGLARREGRLTVRWR